MRCDWTFRPELAKALISMPALSSGRPDLLSRTDLLSRHLWIASLRCLLKYAKNILQRVISIGSAQALAPTLEVVPLSSRTGWQAPDCRNEITVLLSNRFKWHSCKVVVVRKRRRTSRETLAMNPSRLSRMCRIWRWRYPRHSIVVYNDRRPLPAHIAGDPY
jgi:hypothetical protein